MSVPAQVHTRFALITDTHFVFPATGRDSQLWNKQLLDLSERRADLLVHALNSHTLDYVIHCGDLTHYGDWSSFEFTQRFFNRLNAPVIFILGNHDPSEAGIRARLRDKFSLEYDLSRFVKYINGVRYIFLDSNFARLSSGEYSESMRWDQTGLYSGVGFTSTHVAWLKEELARDLTTTTFIFTHHPVASKAEYPIISPRDIGAPHLRIGPVWSKLFPMNYREILDVIEGAPQVKAVFTGHWHINDIVRVNSVYHIKTASLVEYPFEYRVVGVNSSYLEIATHRVEDADLMGASLVPEWHNQWIQGEDFDRHRRIYLDDELIQTKL